MRAILYALLMLLLVSAVRPAIAAAAPPMLPGMDEMTAQMDQDMRELRGLSGKDFEIAYLQKMRLHHLAAIEQARLVPSRATHAELKTFAQRVISDQQREISLMEGWLQTWYGIDKPKDMPMAGMDKMMPVLMALSGADFERAWMMMMMHHHQGAIDMSVLAPGRATHPELLQVAQAIVTAQNKENEQLRQWSLVWYGEDPMEGMPGMSHGPGMPNTGAGSVTDDWQLPAVLGGTVVVLAVALLFLFRRPSRIRR